jgi:hypothetical protein
MNRGGTEIVESGLDRPVVVIGGSFYEDEVSDTRLIGKWRRDELRCPHDVVRGGGEIVVWRGE